MQQMVNGVYSDMTPEQFAEMFPNLPASGPTPADYEAAIQNVIDATAREKQFRDGVTLASYVASTVEPWASQAIAFVAWRDNVWQYAYSELSKVQAGEREQPTIEAFLLELPEMVWPSANQG